MSCIATVDRFISDRVKKGSLTVTDKYRFEDYDSAIEFARALKRVDRRVINYRIREL
jgi:hypothetical protein